jgi:L-malate glycosyltransferase
MKILYTNFHQYHKGGHATYILNLFEALHTRHLVHVADPATSGLNETMRRLAPDCVFAQDFPKRISELPQIFKEALKLRKLIQKNGYDIIHTNGSPDLQLILIACIGLKHKPAIIYTKHNTLHINKNIGSRFKFHVTQHIIMVCGYLRAEFAAIGMPKTRVSVIKNGLDTNAFVPSTPEQRQTMRAQLGINEDDFIVLSSAGTAPYKRWEHMVAAVSKINNQKIKIVFVGGAPSPENQAKYIAALNMTERVIFVGEVIDTRPYVAAGDIGFLLSDSIEAVPFACREMMSMGLPMILSNYACLPENVIQGETGWIVPVGDIKAIKNAVLRL